MTFGEAIEALKIGDSVARKNWKCPSTWLRVCPVTSCWITKSSEHEAD
ncbi:MAG: Thoeris anti-defense Tad2 family protein [Methylocella sp.]